MKLPDMPMGAVSCGATIHNSKVYISAFGKDGNGKPVSPVLVYSTNEHKWSTLPEQQRAAAIALANNHITLIGGQDVSTGKFTNTPSTWYEEKGRWKQVLPPMPTEQYSPVVISHDNLLLVTGGLAEDVSTVLNTTDVLDLDHHYEVDLSRRTQPPCTTMVASLGPLWRVPLPSGWSYGVSLAITRR